MDSKDKLRRFQTENNVFTKGPLALLVQLSRTVQVKEFPLNPDDFLTNNKGQVAGLGGSNLKKILKEHGITRTLASEGGRTSRGNMGLMIKYLAFLNDWHNSESIDMQQVEAYWAEEVSEYFNNLPFTMSADASRTIGANLDTLFEQVRNREKENPGNTYLGTVIQHLVAGKLSVVLPKGSFDIHGAAVADSPTERSGDFVIKNTTIHCTTAPGEPLIQKCKANLNIGCLPVIITIFERVRTALDLAADAGLSGRVDVWDVQQFLSTNVSEHSLFDGSARNTKLGDIISAYNTIIDEIETDPSLKIEFEAN